MTGPQARYGSPAQRPALGGEGRAGVLLWGRAFVNRTDQPAGPRDPKRILAAAALAGASVTLTACGLVEQHYELRYRLTFDIETPQGLRRSSGVLQVTTDLNPIWAPGPQTDAHLTGEAIPISLPNGETLFAVLRGPGTDLLNLSRQAFRPLVDTPEFKQNGRTYYDLGKQNRFLISSKPSAELSMDQVPLLVRFRDMRDPLTVEKVDPADLPRRFGAGYRLRRVTVAITDEPITRGIEKHLPWINTIKNASLDGSKYFSSNTLTNNLTLTSFKSEN